MKESNLVICFILTRTLTSDNNLDGLEFTKAWLQRNADTLYQDSEKELSVNSEATVKQTNGSSNGTDDAQKSPVAAASKKSTPSQNVTPSLLMNVSYAELLDWNLDHVYPEVSIWYYRQYNIVLFNLMQPLLDIKETYFLLVMVSYGMDVVIMKICIQRFNYQVLLW